MIWILPILGFFATIAYISVGTVITRRRYSQGSPRLDPPFNLYPVSILKPLKGADANLSENLESFFHLDYPQYEILFSVADKNDLAIPVVNELLRKYPNHNARLIVGEIQVGTNPKINNLMKSYFESKYDLVLISDSQIQFTNDQLKQIIGHIDTHTGVITAPVIGIEPKGLGGQIEALELTTYVGRMLNFINYLGQPVVLGKTMLIKKSIASRFGGLSTLSNYIAEDYYTGLAVKKLGLNVVLAARPVKEVVGARSLINYANRFIRWGRIRKSQKPFVFLFESIICSLIGPALGSYGLSFLFRISFIKTFSFFVIYHLIFDLMLIKKINPSLMNREILKAWVARQILNTCLYFIVHTGKSVIWRGHRINLKKGGVIDMPATVN